jgi:hypothetical protein
MRIILAAVLLLLTAPHASSFGLRSPRLSLGSIGSAKTARMTTTMSAETEEATGRRGFLKAAGAAVVGLGAAKGASAFDNRIGDLLPSLKGVPYGANTPQPKMVGESGETHKQAHI